MIWLLAGVTVVAMVPAGLRWLRVAQREHYLPGSGGRFQIRWGLSSAPNMFLLLVAAAGLVGSLVDIRWGFLVGLAQVGPIGLAVRGVTSPLAWTDRLRRLALTTAFVALAMVTVGVLAAFPTLVVAPLALLPLLVDLALWVLTPFEKRRGDRWVSKAAERLETVGADVVAITGSYGKTTTKGYTAHLLAGSKRVVASPASFNNRMGLARAVNENLAPGTEIFVAEMGTYGPGEIAELCEWIPPKVAAIVALGPVHLERFKTLDSIVSSKAEILDRAEVGVICVDDERLADLASRRAASMKVIEVSANDGIVVDGEPVMSVPNGVFGANLAAALGICRALGVDLDEALARVSDLPTVEHRQSVSQASGGFTVIDNTFNSNPEGARSALEKLVDVAGGGRTVVVTPGMVELGREQDRENQAFARDAVAVVDDLVIVGRVNRSSLRMGSTNGRASVTVVESRDQAVDWVRDHLGPGDAVLYENDLPDHYP